LNAHISRFGGAAQGTVMGLNSAAASLGWVVGPLLAGWLYDLNFEYPLWSGGAILGIGVLVALAKLAPPK
jgi:DHA1 family quinolone resistance protein-like MFS transporter